MMGSSCQAHPRCHHNQGIHINGSSGEHFHDVSTDITTYNIQHHIQHHIRPSSRQFCVMVIQLSGFGYCILRLQMFTTLLELLVFSDWMLQDFWLGLGTTGDNNWCMSFGKFFLDRIIGFLSQILVLELRDVLGRRVVTNFGLGSVRWCHKCWSGTFPG